MYVEESGCTLTLIQYVLLLGCVGSEYRYEVTRRVHEPCCLLYGGLVSRDLTNAVAVDDVVADPAGWSLYNEVCYAKIDLT